jgi:hypothetical protein
MNENVLVEIINHLPLSELVSAISKIEGLSLTEVLNYLNEIGE